MTLLTLSLSHWNEELMVGTAENRTFKLVLVGDTGVGKTSLVERTVKNCFTANRDCTVGAAFYKYVMQGEDNITITYNIWDTAGQERYRSLGPIYYRGSDAAILVYDITNSLSFANIDGWILTLKKILGSDVLIALVGNKSDLEHRRDVDYRVAKKYANKNDLIFMETSAKNALNIDLLLKRISQELIKRYKTADKTQDRAIRLGLSKQSKENFKKKCC